MAGREPGGTHSRASVRREAGRSRGTGGQGTGAVESWTTPFDRDGKPQQIFLAVRTPDGSRTMAVSRDRDTADASVREDIAGATVDVHVDGTATLR